MDLHRTDPDQEMTEYRNGQISLAKQFSDTLQKSLDKELTAGSFVFRGVVSAVTTKDSKLIPASKNF